MDQIIPLSDIESVVLPRFIPMIEVLSQECESFKDDFENGDFSRWSGTYASQGETFAVVNETAYRNLHSARFSSDGNSLFEAGYCYKTLTSLSELQISAYFKVAYSGITADDARFYLIVLKVAGNSVAYVGWRQVAGVVKWNLLVRTGIGWASDYSDTSPLVNKWYSVKLAWFEDPLNGHAELYVEDVLACSIENIKTATSGQTEIRFGLPELYNCDSTTLYCDSCGVDIARTSSSEMLLGDINRDGSVNVYDAIIAAASFGSVLGDQLWNSAADLNKDNKVDIYDMLILASKLHM